MHSFSGQPVPVPHHPQSKEFLPYISSKSTFFQLEAIIPYLVAIGPAKTPVPIFPVSPLQLLEGRDKVSLEPSLLQAEQPQISLWMSNNSYARYVWDDGQVISSKAPECLSHITVYMFTTNSPIQPKK